MKELLRRLARLGHCGAAIWGRRVAVRDGKKWFNIGQPSARTRLAALRRDVARLMRIDPIVVASNRPDYLAARADSPADRIAHRAAEATRQHPGETFHLRRFCLCCNETMPMLVDYQFGGEPHSRTPNWRERLVCAGCGMNNRQRLVAKLVQQCAVQYRHPRVYLMEQVTPIFAWVKRLGTVDAEGSEYLGHQYRGGDQVQGIRHEDVMDLSYPDETFDLIVSNDVLEHIPDPALAFRECFRVLKKGGAMLATFPFHLDLDITQVRARLDGNSIEHLLPPRYHGNPVSSEGSLVFQDFGWDLLDSMRAAGFSSVHCESYASDEFGHLGPGLLVFRLCKSGGSAAG